MLRFFNRSLGDGHLQSLSLSADKADQGRSLLPTAAALFLLLAVGLHAEPADYIYTARYIVTMDAQHRLIDDGAIAIRADRIVAVGKRADIEKQFQAKQRVDRPNALIMPGLINTHTHAAMSLLRGIADDLRLQDWLEKYIFPAEAKNVTPDFVLWGTRLACLEMMLSGTTTYVDMYYFEDRVAQATRKRACAACSAKPFCGSSRPIPHPRKTPCS
jgi:5-methylthioadenosine/S-adenosylhomocysteine deaminase